MLAHVAEIKSVEAVDDVIVLSIGMPGARVAIAVAVDEDGDVGEGVVVGGEVGEVGVGFTAFVYEELEGIGFVLAGSVDGGVGDVDCGVPTIKE